MNRPIATLLSALRAQWKLASLTTAIVLVATILYTLLAPQSYIATSTVYVAAQTSDSANAAYQGGLLSQQRVTSYAQLANSDRVVNEVIGRLGLRESPTQLAGRISTVTSPQSVLIEIRAESDDPSTASDIANSVVQSLVTIVDEIENPVVPNVPQAVALRVVQPAFPPLTSSSPAPALMILGGLVCGLLLGAGLAVARYQADRSIRDVESLRVGAGLPVLGEVPFDEEVASRVLTAEDSGRPSSEAYRRLRTNLQFVDVDSTHKEVVVTSALPAEGKTTTVVNLAAALGMAGNKVVVIEADLRQPALSTALGLDSTVGLTTVLSKQVPTSVALQPGPHRLFQVLSAGQLPPNPSEILGSNQMASLRAELKNQFDIVLIDTPPLLPVTDAAELALNADGYIVVCRANSTHLHQLNTAIEALRAVSGNVFGAVLTMSRSARSGRYGGYYGYTGRQSSPARTTATSVGDDESAITRPNPASSRSSGPSPSPRRKNNLPADTNW